MRNNPLFWDDVADRVMLVAWLTLLITFIVLLAVGCIDTDPRVHEHVHVPVIVDESTAQEIADSLTIVRKSGTSYCFAFSGDVHAYDRVGVSVTWVPCPDDMK